MKVTVKVLRNEFGKMPAAARRGVAKGFASAKGPLLADMQRRTPVDTGELRGSETAESNDASLTLTAGSDHALYVHQGTRRMAARPFMRDAIEAGLPSIVKALQDGITSEMK